MKTALVKLFTLIMMVVLAASMVLQAGMAVPVRTGDILYVKPGGVGGCTESWANACGLQTALGMAALP